MRGLLSDLAKISKNRLTSSRKDEGDAGQSHQGRTSLSGSDLESGFGKVESGTDISLCYVVETYAKKLIPRTSSKFERTDPKSEVWTSRSSPKGVSRV
jgi:hypothetical protein